ncbi:MAG: ABC transporter permease [Acidobacteria bacterium]|nr:MAG: ABC transporter permease [Acidobacteriota bacterium]
MSGRQDVRRETQPPRVARWLLSVLVPRKNREFILGDLDEEFHRLVEEPFGLPGAHRWYWKQAWKCVANPVPPDRLEKKQPESTGIMDTLRQDVRYAIRMLGQAPGFTAVAVLTLALGIGANTAIFSVLHAVLLEPLPFPEPERLVMIWNSYAGKPAHNSPPDYFDRLHSSKLLERIAAFRPASFNLTGQGEPERLEGARVTASFFSVLGQAPVQGRVFLEEEDRPERNDAVVLSHGCWLRRLGGKSDAIGKSLRLNDREFRIAGVMGASFSLLFPDVEIWAPMAFEPDAQSDGERGNEYLLVIGRSRRQATLGQVQAEMSSIAASVLDRVPSRRDFLSRANWDAQVVPLREHYAGNLRPVVFILFGSVVLLLLIACANIANLLLARAAAREREFSIRAALCARQGRMLRQLLVENVCLSIAGGVPGLLLGWWSIGILKTTAQLSPLLAAARLDWAVLAFAGGLMFITSFLFGLVPAIRASSFEVVQAINSAGRSSVSNLRQPLRRALVVSEVALALLLLVAAGLLLRSSQSLWRVHPGYETAQRLTFRVWLPASRYPDNPQRISFHSLVLEGLNSLPGVTAAGAIQSLPIDGTSDTATVHVEGYVAAPGRPPLSCEYRNISPEYFRAMGIPLLQGRDFSAADDVDSPLVIIVDERAARQFWPGQNPIGKRLGFSPRRLREVIGVVGSVRNQGLDVIGQEQVYIPLFQEIPPSVFYVLHAQTAQPTLAAAARGAVRAVDPNMPIYDVRTMDERVAGSLAQRRLATTLLAMFAAVAILLAVVGIYGVIAYWVRQRTQEIGIRMALGARPRQVFRLVVVQGMIMVLIGMALGAVSAVAATRLLKGLLFGVKPHDPFTFLVVAALLLSAAFLACFVPAWRAMRLAPTVALRREM